MIDAATIEGIADVPLFRNWSSEQMTCLGGGEEVIVPAGGRIAEEGVCAAYFFVLLSGRVRVTKREGEMETEITTYAPGTFFGELPILMDTPYVASAYAAENCRLLRLGREAFWHLLSRCPSASRDILHTMAGRVQHLESITQERERLAALGTLAAGLAHEVNNPMAAGSRAISQARDAGARQLAALRLLTPALTPAQWDALFAAAPSAALETGALEMGVREDALAGWLDSREMSGDLAPGLAEAGWSERDLDTLAAGVPDSALSPAMAWLEARAAAETALETAARSARRVSEMVGAIREYTFLDQGRAQSVDIAAALENTLTILGSRLNGLQVVRDFAPELPPITGDGAELNQVWTAPARQCPRCRRAGRVSFSPGGPRRHARSRGNPRQRPRHPRRHSPAHLRAVFYDQRSRPGDGAGPRHRPAGHHQARRRHPRSVSARRHARSSQTAD